MLSEGLHPWGESSSYGRDESRPVPLLSGPRGVMNHARTNDPLPFLPCFTSKDVDPSVIEVRQRHIHSVIISMKYITLLLVRIDQRSEGEI